MEAKSVRKATVPSSLIPNPSPASNFHASRLSLHVSHDGSSCWLYVASGPLIYKLQIAFEDTLVSKGKDSLLIPVHTEVLDSLLVNRCPHRSEIQSIELAESESMGYLLLGSVDSYGDVIVSKLDTNGKDIDRLTYTVSPRDCGVGESSWAGLCFSPMQWSMRRNPHLALSPSCRSMCKEEGETLDHLMLHCKVASGCGKMYQLKQVFFGHSRLIVDL